MEVKKLFYSMGEVAEMFDVNASLIRYWESQFDQLRPRKNKKGNRMFSPEDVEQLKLIYHLVKEKGMTLEGAKKSLRQNRGGLLRDAELLERLQRLRSMLVEVREELKEEPVREASASGPQTVPQGKKVRPVRDTEDIRQRGEVETEIPKPDRKGRKTRSGKENEGVKELFAFYEQSLF